MLKISELLDLKVPIVLASASPRRKHLLESLGFEFTIQASNFDEESMEYLSPENYVQELAYQKAKNIAENLSYPAIVIGADTTVILDNKMLNKPSNPEHAYQMLSMLSDNWHYVYTGISIVDSTSKKYIKSYVQTKVHFRKLDDKEIWAYINSGSPMDKAGAYGIQDDFGALFVSRIEGCYYNVVGLPLEHFYEKLKEFLIS